MDDDDTKACPYCAETIKRAAKLCRYCHMDLATGEPAGATQSAGKPVSPDEVKARSGVWDGVKIGFGIFVVLPILLLAGYLVFLAMFAGAPSNESRNATSFRGYSAPSSVGDYTPPTAEEIRAANEVTTARNRGHAYATEHAVKSAADCAPLTDPNERAGCEAVAGWK